MDDRRRFLYCVAAELWGRMRGACAGGRRARRKRRRPRGGKAPRGRPVPRRGAKIGVAKHAVRVPRKAAMDRHVPVPQTDTGGQGEDPKAGGRSIAKELGKMAP